MSMSETNQVPLTRVYLILKPVPLMAVEKKDLFSVQFQLAEPIVAGLLDRKNRFSQGFRSRITVAKDKGGRNSGEKPNDFRRPNIATMENL